uniref:Ig-like domain-containing protein n=1 Tax=Pelusios castaneus TaxID=367368 RepID=A0A8C8RFC2_9SAUR
MDLGLEMIYPVTRSYPLCDANSLSSLGALRTSQEPRSLNVTAGESVTLSCTFQNREGSTAKALWLRGSRADVVLDSNHPFYRARLNVSRLDEVTQGKATLILSDVEERDSGLYRCCIETHNKEMGIGEGTQLRVMQRIQTATGEKLRLESRTELTIYRAVIALAAIGIILLAGVLVLHRRKGIYPSFHTRFICLFFRGLKFTSLPRAFD